MSPPRVRYACPNRAVEVSSPVRRSLGHNHTLMIAGAPPAFNSSIKSPPIREAPEGGRPVQPPFRKEIASTTHTGPAHSLGAGNEHIYYPSSMSLGGGEFPTSTFDLVVNSGDSLPISRKERTEAWEASRCPFAHHGAGLNSLTHRSRNDSVKFGKGRNRGDENANHTCAGSRSTTPASLLSTQDSNRARREPPFLLVTTLKTSRPHQGL